MSYGTSYDFEYDLQFESNTYHICGFVPEDDRFTLMDREYHGGMTYAIQDGVEKFRIRGAFKDPAEMRIALIGAWGGWNAHQREPARQAENDPIVKIFRTELAEALKQVRNPAGIEF